ATLQSIETTREAYAAYIDVTYHLSDRLSISGGGRYSREKVTISAAVQTAAQIPLGTYTVGPVTEDASFSKFTPRATIRYEIAPQANIYTSYSQGIKSGGWSGPPLLRVEPENIKAYEVGFKIARP